MASTNKTQNLNLSQFVASDKPGWLTDYNNDMQKIDEGIFNKMYPVGSIYMSVNSVNPSTLFGGTWEAWGSGQVPVGVDMNDADFETAEKAGGEKAVALVAANHAAHIHSLAGTGAAAVSAGAHTHTYNFRDNATFVVSSGGNLGLPSAVIGQTSSSSGAHTHTLTGSSASQGSGAAHNNLQPYITCYMWKRTA